MLVWILILVTDVKIYSLFTLNDKAWMIMNDVNTKVTDGNAGSYTDILMFLQKSDLQHVSSYTFN